MVYRPSESLARRASHKYRRLSHPGKWYQTEKKHQEEVLLVKKAYLYLGNNSNKKFLVCTILKYYYLGT